MGHMLSFRLENIHFHILRNTFLFEGMLSNCVYAFLEKEGGIHVWGGLALSSQTVEFAGQKINLINVQAYIFLLTITLI